MFVCFSMYEKQICEQIRTYVRPREIDAENNGYTRQTTWLWVFPWFCVYE